MEEMVTITVRDEGRSSRREEWEEYSYGGMCEDEKKEVVVSEHGSPSLAFQWYGGLLEFESHSNSRPRWCLRSHETRQMLRVM